MIMLKEILKDIKVKLDMYQDKREQTIIICRRILRKTRECIKNIHLQDFKKVRAIFTEIEKDIREIWNMSKEEPKLLYSGLLNDALKEYVEARVFFDVFNAVISNQEIKISTPSDLKVPEEVYILGLSEVAGEIKREIVYMIRENKFNVAWKMIDFLSELYNELAKLVYPGAIIPGFKNRVDYVRIILVSSEELLVRTMKEYKIIEIISKSKEFRS